MQTQIKNGQTDIAAETLWNMLDHIDIVVFRADLAGGHRFLFASRMLETLTGYPRADFIEAGKNWMDLVHAGDREYVQKKYQQCLEQGTAVNVEYRLIRADGGEINLQEHLGKPDGVTRQADGWIIDNSERKRVQVNLERTQMLQSIGRLSAGIAHEINTPIQFIGDNIKFLSDSFGQVNHILELYEEMENARAEKLDGRAPELLEQIQKMRTDIDLSFLVNEIPQAIEQSLEGIKRVSTMLSAMRDFSHMDERRVTSVDLNKVIKSTAVISRNEYKYIADILLELDENLPRVTCCQDDMNQVFLNLIVNAAHSIADKISDEKNKRGTITIRSFVQEDEVVVSIGDTGMGIPPEIQEHIFEPFFTTKEFGRGTGQGLCITRSIVVEKHKGRLDYETRVGKGTTFNIYLPMNFDMSPRI